MLNLVQSVAQNGGYIPHGAALQWNPELVWLHVLSDALTGAAYWAIPPALFILVWKARKEIPPDDPYGPKRLPYDWVFVAFGIFIIACGTTHFMGVVTIWEPTFWVAGGVKAVTAIASVATAIALPPLVPKALALIRDARDAELRRIRLEEANAQLERLNDRLKESDRLKSELVANVSHELRTPLSLILGPAQELLEGGSLSPEANADVELMRKNARSLLGQVDDLLDAARLEVGALAAELQAVDVADMVRETVHQFTPIARNHEVTLQVMVPDELAVEIDPEKTERILLNLLSNAFKFTPIKGVVVVSLERREDEGRERIVLEVRDSGPGVSSGQRSVIFERFRQADDVSPRVRGGIGLGLSISREYAEIQGGSLTVDEAPEGGARFVLRLPYRPAEAAHGAATWQGTGRAQLERARMRSRNASSTGMVAAAREEASDAEKVVDEEAARLLVVEDDPELRAFMEGVLEKRYRLRTAADGVEGLEAVEEERPDIILVDVMMPRMDGEEFLAELRARPEYSGIPVLILTAKADPELVSRLLRGGAQDYMLKPVGRDELMARIDRHLDIARTRAILQNQLSSRESRLRVLAGTAARQKVDLERALDEKSVLVQELHHRVKGNLQTITSLLNLQIRRLEDENARNTLVESRGRIAAMAILHEKLYQTDDPVGTEMDSYLESLVRDLVQTWGVESEEITVDVVADEIRLGADHAVSCGLLVHELVTNSIRHGYPAGGPGRIEVRMESRPGSGECILSVEDDGVGLESIEATESSRSLGMSLVRALARQLDARLEIEEGAGVRSRITFSVDRETVQERTT